MSGTISVSFTASVSNGEFSDSLQIRSTSYTQTNIGASSGVRSIGTTEEVISTGDVAVEGFVYMKNLDSSNFIEYGPDSGGTMVSFGKLEPGEFAWFRLKPGITFKAKADTAAVLVDIRIYED